MNELGRLLVVEIVKSKFHQIKKKIIKKKRIWWQKISKSLTRNIHYFYFLCERAVEKFWTAKNFGRRKFRTVKFSDTLLSELFLRPNFFVINVC